MNSAKPFIIAHRGARSMAPENTLAAGILAHSQGAHMWEIDVRLTADGVPVLVHDASLARTTNVALKPAFTNRFPWLLSQFSLKELAKLNAGEWFVCADPFHCIGLGQVEPAKLKAYFQEGIPTLQAALQLVKTLNWKINIEIKIDDNELHKIPYFVQAVLDLLASTNTASVCLVSSFSQPCLEQVRRVAPTLTTAYLFKDVDIEQIADSCKDMGILVLHPHVDSLPIKAIAHLREQDFLIHPWTINDKYQAKTLLDAGATGIITDFPIDYYSGPAY